MTIDAINRRGVEICKRVLDGGVRRRDVYAGCEMVRGAGERVLGSGRTRRGELQGDDAARDGRGRFREGPTFGRRERTDRDRGRAVRSEWLAVCPRACGHEEHLA